MPNWPNSPVVDQIYSEGGRSWKFNGRGWDGVAWDSIGGPTISVGVDPNQELSTTRYNTAFAKNDVDVVIIGDSMSTRANLDLGFLSWSDLITDQLKSYFDDVSVEEVPSENANYRVHNLSHPGWSISDHLDNDLISDLEAIDPDLIVLCCGLIDYLDDGTGEIYLNNITRGIDSINSRFVTADKFLIHQYEPEASGWENFGDNTRQPTYDLATSKGWGYLSLYNAVGSKSNDGDPKGLFYFSPTPGDGIHMNRHGHRLLADILLPVFIQNREPRKTLVNDDVLLTTMGGQVTQHHWAGTGVVGVLTETELHTTLLNILANVPKIGSSFELYQSIFLLNLGGSPQTFRVRPKVGGTAVNDRIYTIAGGAGLSVVAKSIITFQAISPSPSIHVDSTLESGTGLAVGEVHPKSTASSPLTHATTSNITCGVTILNNSVGNAAQLLHAHLRPLS